MSRQDDVNILYQKSKWLNNTAIGLYIGNCCVLLLDYFFPACNYIWFWLQLLLVILFLGVSLTHDCHYRYEADKERRNAKVEDAFDIDFTEYKTAGYYNNNVPPSLCRYVMDSFESVLFTKSIVGKMLPRELFKAFIVGIIFLLSLRIADNNLLLLILEIVTSAYLFQGIIMTIFFYSKVKAIYLNLYQLLITEKTIQREQLILAFSAAQEYEVCKAYFKVAPDSKLFIKLNPELSEQWEKMAAKISFPENIPTL